MTTRLIDKAKLEERIALTSASVTGWAETRLVVDTTEATPISRLFDDYEGFCRERRCLPLPRKVWIASMKLAGFDTQSGAFSGLKLRMD